MRLPLAGSKWSVSWLDRPPRRDQLALALELGFDPALEEAEAVHVLQLGLGPQLLAAGRAHGDVGVDPQAPLLHVDVGDAELAHRLAQQARPLGRFGGVAQVGLGDDLDQRRAAAVEVDQRGGGAVDPARVADVDRLRRVLLEVGAVDADVAELAGPQIGMSYWLIW